mgnify:CR=1 FL=1
MKIRLAALLACMALSAPLAAQQFDTISFGVDGGYPPFDVLAPSGEITGFDIDIANALCTQLKAKCVFVKQPFESMIAAIQAETIRRIFLARVQVGSTTVKRERVAKGMVENVGGDGTAPKKQPVKVNKIGRNDPCPCGSGKKFKKCCGQ